GSAIASLARLGVVLLSFAVYGAGLLLVAPVITVAVAGSGAILGYLTRYFRKSAEALNRRLMESNELFIQFLAERYRSWRLVKLSVTTDLENAKFGEQARGIGALTIAVIGNSAAVQMLVTPAGALFMLVGLYVSVEYFGLSVAELTLFVLVYLRINPLT